MGARVDVRRCDCGHGAPVTRTVMERLKSVLPIGRVHQHDCPSCGATFNVHDGFAIAFSVFAASILTAVGALVVVNPPGAAVGAADTNRWFGVGLLVIGLLAWIVPVLRVRQRLRHPIQRPTEF